MAKRTECPVGQAIEIVVAGRVVALFNVDGQIFALDGVCPHQGGPLGKGALCDRIVTCPWHGWQFDVKNGENQITPTITQPTLGVVVEGDDILIDEDDLHGSE